MRILELLLLSQIWIFDFFVGNNIFLINDRFLWVGCFSFVFGGGLFILFKFRVDSSLSIFENDAQKNLKHVLFECKYLLTISILFRFQFHLISFYFIFSSRQIFSIHWLLNTVNVQSIVAKKECKTLFLFWSIDFCSYEFLGLSVLKMLLVMYYFTVVNFKF